MFLLLDISFIVDELHKGQRVVYRYPTKCPYSEDNMKEIWKTYNEKYSAIDDVQFAKLFRPKPKMFHKCFELVIDDIHYFSFPTPCMDTNDDHYYVDNTITLFNVVIATIRNNTRTIEENVIKEWSSKNNNSDTPKGIKMKIGENKGQKEKGQGFITLDVEILRRAVKTLSRNLLLEEKRLSYVSREVELILTLQGRLESDSNQMDARHVRDGLLLRSHLVNVLRSVFHSLLTGQTLKVPSSRGVTIDLLLNLDHNHNRDHGSHDNNNNICENNNNKHKIHSSSSSPSSSSSMKHENYYRGDMNNMRPYHSLLCTSQAETSIVTNDNELDLWNRVQVGINSGVGDREGDFGDNGKSMAIDSIDYLKSPDLSHILSHTEPTLSLEMLAANLELTMEEMVINARHADLWNIGRVLKTFTLSSVYRVNNNCRIDQHSVFFANFINQLVTSADYVDHTNINRDYNPNTPFSDNENGLGLDNLNMESNTIGTDDYGYTGVGNGTGTTDNHNRLVGLHETLALFDGRRNIEVIQKELPVTVRDFVVDIVLWLLQQDLLREVQVYLFSHPLNSNDTHNKNSNNNNNDDNNHNKNSIAYPGINGEDSFKKYLSGRHTLEEVIWNERIPKSVLLQYINSRSDIITQNR